MHVSLQIRVHAVVGILFCLNIIEPKDCGIYCMIMTVLEGEVLYVAMCVQSYMTLQVKVNKYHCVQCAPTMRQLSDGIGFLTTHGISFC